MANTKYGSISAGATAVIALDGNVRDIEIINRTGTGEMWVEIDPTDDSNLTPGTAGLEFLPAAISFINVQSLGSQSPTKVKIHSVTAQSYAVKGQ